jgi:putative membrane protein
MTKFLIRLGINAVAIYAAIRLVHGIHMETTSWVAIVVLALIFGLVNTLIAPILKLLTCPFILITLGLFTLLINTFLFWLTGGIGKLFGVGFSAGFVDAFLGALIVTIVNVVLSAVFREELKTGN